jgi:hypothetical protein
MEDAVILVTALAATPRCRPCWPTTTGSASAARSGSCARALRDSRPRVRRGHHRRAGVEASPPHFVTPYEHLSTVPEPCKARARCFWWVGEFEDRFRRPATPGSSRSETGHLEPVNCHRLGRHVKDEHRIRPYAVPSRVGQDVGTRELEDLPVVQKGVRPLTYKPGRIARDRPFLACAMRASGQALMCPAAKPGSRRGVEPGEAPMRRRPFLTRAFTLLTAPVSPPRGPEVGEYGEHAPVIVR